MWHGACIVQPSCQQRGMALATCKARAMQAFHVKQRRATWRTDVHETCHKKTTWVVRKVLTPATDAASVWSSVAGKRPLEDARMTKADLKDMIEMHRILCERAASASEAYAQTRSDAAWDAKREAHDARRNFEEAMVQALAR